MPSPTLERKAAKIADNFLDAESKNIWCSSRISQEF
jgi:hypothetical protein